MSDSFWAENEFGFPSDDEKQPEVLELNERPDGLFLVHRTSTYRSLENPPCEGAFLVSIVNVDRRNCDDPKKIPINNGTDGDWWDRGENHRIENGNICRDIGRDVHWAVICNDIYEFAKKVENSVIIEHHYYGNWNFPELEIYDDYSE